MYMFSLFFPLFQTEIWCLTNQKWQFRIFLYPFILSLLLFHYIICPNVFFLFFIKWVKDMHGWPWNNIISYCSAHSCLLFKKGRKKQRSASECLLKLYVYLNDCYTLAFWMILAPFTWFYRHIIALHLCTRWGNSATSDTIEARRNEKRKK